MEFLKSALYFTGGILWLLFGAGFAILLWQFLTNGAGSQFLGDFISTVSSGSVLLGMIYFIGLSVASVFCFAISVNLFLKTRRANQ